jgi:eukaryotic-like serine/threonine-protein kinase
MEVHNGWGRAFPAVVTTGAVYFGSFDGHYYAVDRVTGKEKWRFKTGGEQWMGAKGYWGMKPSDQYMEDLWDFYLSSPILDSTPDGTTLYFGSSDGTVYALNPDTGTERWKFKTSGSIHSSPALYGGVVYIGSWDAHLYALDAKSGALKWKFKTGGDVGMTGILSSPTIHNGLVYFGARDAKFYALSAETGELRWTYDANGSWIMSTAAVRGNFVYTTTSDSFLFVALDAATGAEQFRFKANGYVFSSPALVGNTAFFGDFTGKMFAVDLSSKGTSSREFVTPARKEYSKSLLKDDFLDFGYLAAGGDFSFYKTSSDVMKKLYKLGPIVSSPVVDEDVIYFGSADGYVYAVKLQIDRPGSAQQGH